MVGRKRRRERAEQVARERLRGRIVTGLHVGHVQPGERLPSYREVAVETGLDLRTVARVYATLESEGLVHVRPRSGVFVARQERIGGGMLAETARWTLTVLRESWRRRVPVQEYPDFVRRCVASRVLRCTCVESTRDQLTTMCAELRDEASDRGALARLHPTRPVLVTKAARKSLQGVRLPPTLRTSSAHVMSPRSADEVLEVLIRLNLEAAAEAPQP